MQIVKKVRRKVAVCSDVICNRCGESCLKYLTKNSEFNSYEYATISASWGFYSQKDGMITRAHLCEGCMEIIEKDFKIPATCEDE
jgi:hypothetical protein